MSVRTNSFLLMVLLAAASAGVFWVLTEHWRHALGFAPYALFFLCPLLHLFMHGGHGKGDRTHHHDQKSE